MTKIWFLGCTDAYLFEVTDVFVRVSGSFPPSLVGMFGRIKKGSKLTLASPKLLSSSETLIYLRGIVILTVIYGFAGNGCP